MTNEMKEAVAELEMAVIEKGLKDLKSKSDLADDYIDEALSKGESFSEALCNWAITRAEQVITERKLAEQEIGATS